MGWYTRYRNKIIKDNIKNYNGVIYSENNKKDV